MKVKKRVYTRTQLANFFDLSKPGIKQRIDTHWGGINDKFDCYEEITVGRNGVSKRSRWMVRESGFQKLMQGCREKNISFPDPETYDFGEPEYEEVEVPDYEQEVVDEEIVPESSVPALTDQSLNEQILYAIMQVRQELDLELEVIKEQNAKLYDEVSEIKIIYERLDQEKKQLMQENARLKFEIDKQKESKKSLFGRIFSKKEKKDTSKAV